MEVTARFEYPECSDVPFVPAWPGWEQGNAAEPAGRGEKPGAPEVEQRLAEETARAFEAGRVLGVAEGREAERAANGAANAAAQEDRIRQAAEMLAGFEQQRGHYFQSVEQEAVQLALAIAARILRREAHADPLLLMGAVRVALGQIAASTEITLRVPPKELELWTEAIALLPRLRTKPLVVAGEGMRLGECVIETSLGSADLGIPSQLAEIERSLVERDKHVETGGGSSSEMMGTPSIEVAL